MFDKKVILELQKLIPGIKSLTGYQYSGLTESKAVVKGNDKSYVICPKMITRIEEYNTNHCIVHYLNGDSFAVYMSLDDLTSGLGISKES
ncbi:hypothetical protein H5202_20245 [Shewanella sp. SG41-4]|uniref:hypothetical protein n=1 Tax=Shewanella sp. SG41-4 TaxID=2760976 RepID=UPI0015FFE002|nr:hypothetical protein [Shewanella sp. SG41-4]MBB1440942.1 hypothetical protein [Shewanella sp. SG41-4]